jgi:site-specific DNA-methyltransferase (adenine-specific)
LQSQQLILGDCLDVLPKILNESIDLIITSPPYDNLRDYNNSLVWNFDIFKNIANELNKSLKNGGVIVWIVNDATIKGSETGTSFKQALYFKEIGLNLHDTMIWQKESFTAVGSLKTRYAPVFEYMFILSKGKPKTFNPLKDRKNKYAGHKVHGTIRQKTGQTKSVSNNNVIKEYGIRFNIWKITPNKNNTTNHPAVFPIKLVQDHIKTWSNENDLVLDCFMGSGTTGIACKNLNRKFIGIEKDQNYFNIAKNRIKVS